MTKVILAIVLSLFTSLVFADNKMSCVKGEALYKNKGETFVLYTAEGTSKELKKSSCKDGKILMSGERISISRLEADTVSGGDKNTPKHRNVKLNGSNQFTLFLISKKYKGKAYDNCDSISTQAYSCG